MSGNVFVDFTTNFGVMRFRLYEIEAPETVANFLDFVDKHIYNNTIIHRIQAGFKIYGGRYNEHFSLIPQSKIIPNESINGLSNIRGSLAISSVTGANSRWCINLAGNTFLDYKNDTEDLFKNGVCVFGMLVDGWNVLEAIEQEPVMMLGQQLDVPVNQIIVQQINRVV